MGVRGRECMKPRARKVVSPPLSNTDLLVDGKWERDGDGDKPHSHDEHQTDGRLHARSERVNDDEVARYLESTQTVQTLATMTK